MVGCRIVHGGHGIGQCQGVVAEQVRCSEGYSEGRMNEVLYALLILLYADWILGLALKDG